MKDANYKNAFGKAPESFQNRVASALSHMEEERKVKKFSIRLIVIAAILLILMAGVVYAASTEWRLFDFFNSGYHRRPGEELQKALNEINIMQSFDAGDYTITLREAIADGKYLYITATVQVKEGRRIYMMPVGAEPKDSISVWAANAGGKSDGEKDQRTFLQAANEEKKRLVAVQLGYNIHFKSDNPYNVYNRNNDRMDFALHSGNALHFVLGGKLIPEDNDLLIQIAFSAQDWNEKEGYKEKGIFNETYQLELSVTDSLNKKTVMGHGVKIPDTDVVIDSVDLMLTPLTMHYEIHYTRETKTPINVEEMGIGGLWFRFLDEKGTTISDGLSLGGSRGSRDGIHFIQTGSIMMEKMPKGITLQGYDRGTSKLYGTATMKME